MDERLGVVARGVVLVVMAQQIELGEEGGKGKAAAQGVVYQGDGAVGRVHRRHQIEVGGQGE